MDLGVERINLNGLLKGLFGLRELFQFQIDLAE